MLQVIIDFITLKIFITPYLIVFIYLTGAFGVPLGAWFLTNKFINSHDLVTDTYEAGVDLARELISKRYRGIGVAVFLFIFVLLEILWRLIFEFLIAYYQIRDALMELAY